MKNTLKALTITGIAIMFLASCVSKKKYLDSQIALRYLQNDSAALANRVHNLEANVADLEQKIKDLTAANAKLAEDAGITKTQANAAIDSFTEAVAKTLKKGDTVTLVGFGTFSVSKRSARTGRNPQTGAAIKIAAKKVAKFKAGADLSKAVNK